MRWPEWTEKFRHCCGCCEGPHNAHYDAWLARERLAQVKRLEVKLADLSKDNAVLSAQLGQAVSVLDSYHSFDMDAIAANDPQNRGLQAEQRSDSSRRTISQDGSGGRPARIDPSPTNSGRLASANHISRRALMGGVPGYPAQSSGRMGSLQVQPASRSQPIGEPVTTGSARLGSLQPKAAPKAWQQQPGRLTTDAASRRLSTDSNATVFAAASAQASPKPNRRLAEIPTSEEIDSLLARRANRRPKAKPAAPEPTPQPNRSPPPLATPAVAPAATAPADSLERAQSAHLPAVGSLAAMPMTVVPLPTVHESDGSARSSESFEFSTPAATQMDPVALPAFAAAVPQIGVLQGPAVQPVAQPSAVPVLDQAALSHQVRGQIYTGHYSPQTSPFAQAAARMPRPGPPAPRSDPGR